MKQHWRHGPQDLNQLQALGILTARLLRLLVHQKVKRGDAQLLAGGIDANLANLYARHAKHAKVSMPVLVPPKPKNFVLFIETKTSEF